MRSRFQQNPYPGAQSKKRFMSRFRGGGNRYTLNSVVSASIPMEPVARSRRREARATPLFRKTSIFFPEMGHEPNGTSLRVVGLEWLSLRDLPATVGWLALIAPSR